ncbi:MAG TPA: ABC transporter ATP-binding protein [Bacteroidota bacterium]|nr:ABC transporter ATP-binding protein [Bacteroidota bacterium]
MPIVIKVENLSKKYAIPLYRPDRYLALRDVLTNRTKALAHKLLHPVSSKSASPTTEDFFALKNISFEINQGDRVGIIGRNGAGKSTLLKVLSRITEPTSGRVSTKGRVASLLEVGTGFHPELTGRENIFLNGAIIGMTKAEINKKFDEIVAFAEVEKFLETPVKRYSSGMYVRLAFAIAAHLEPEILIIDEVLAVGDAQFQKKCLGKMEEVSTSQGRTVLFVSHQMGAVVQLCNKGIMLDKGKLIKAGSVNDVIKHYMNYLMAAGAVYEDIASARNKEIAILKAQTFDSEGNPAATFPHNQEIVIKITCKINKWIQGAEVRVAVRDSKRNVFTTDTEIKIEDGSQPDMILATVIIPAGLLRPETYAFTLVTYYPNQVTYHLIRDALSVSVFDGGSKYAASEGMDYGCVFVDCPWSIERVSLTQNL